MARIHDKLSKKEAWDRAVDMLRLVGIPSRRSGRRCTRTSSPAACASGRDRHGDHVQPDLLIADEPTTALDVTVQAQVLDVLMEMKDEIDSSIVLITHDLGVVAGLADRVIVMYAEARPRSAPPTRSSTRPSIRTPSDCWRRCRLDDTGVERLRPIRGAPPSLLNPPSGCAFHPRCDFAGAAARGADAAVVTERRTTRRATSPRSSGTSTSPSSARRPSRRRPRRASDGRRGDRYRSDASRRPIERR